MIDVVDIILKSRKHLEKCWVDVEAEVADEHPKVYTKIHLTYNFKSPDLDDKVAERAIQLSKEKYCSVTAMLSPTVPITHSHHIEK
jgi:putative redox protein